MISPLGLTQSLRPARRGALFRGKRFQGTLSSPGSSVSGFLQGTLVLHYTPLGSRKYHLYYSHFMDEETGFERFTQK